jgi:hypothetical protein
VNLRKYRGRQLQIALFLTALFPLLRASDIEVLGRVVDENGAPVRNAHLSISAFVSPVRLWEAETDATGEFRLTLPEPGDYLVAVDRQGFYALKSPSPSPT